MIRRARRSDVESLATLDAQLFADDPLPPETFLQEVVAGFSWVVEEDKTVVGYAVARFQDQMLDILRLAVDPNYQGLGLGSRLLERALRESPRAILTVRKGNKVISLYQKYGFRIVGDLGAAWVMTTSVGK